MKVESVTGSPDRTGLALTLEQQPGLCAGLAFRIPSDLEEAEIGVLARREFILFNYSVETTPTKTPQGEIQVVVPTSDAHEKHYVAGLSLSDTAAL